MRPKNAVLSSISDKAFERLVPHLTPVTLKAGDVLHPSDSAPKNVYFLNAGVAELSVSTANGTELELSIVGREGTVGERAIFDYDFFIIKCSMLTDGHGYKMDPEKFKKEFKRDGSLHDLIINNLEARVTEASQTSLCNQSHSVIHRLSRWMLTLADRAGLEEMNITQGTISKALGVTRSSITRAAIKLKEKGIIDYVHGNIVILDRFDLEKESCECYFVIEEAMNALRRAGNRGNL